MSYVTIYTRKIKRRKTGIVETVGLTYTTKSLTPMHAYIRATYPDAQTWQNPERVTTDFVPGMNLGTLPLVRGGTRVTA
jgi:hypothetical protein